MKKYLKKGFTLVELLIVIGLLGAIALIVIAAINPIEQANRARDTRFKSDAGQLISAIDRYFVATDEFPWMSDDDSLKADSPLTFVSAEDISIGICGASCDADGYLIERNELKTEFRNRNFLQDADTDEDRIFVGKAQGASSSVYACYIPLSKAERSKTDNFVNKEFDAAGNPTECTDPDWESTFCYVCLPQ